MPASLARPAISSRLEETTHDSADFAFLGTNVDTLDDTNFPRQGFLVSAAAARYWYRELETPVQTYVAEIHFDVQGLMKYSTFYPDRCPFRPVACR